MKRFHPGLAAIALISMLAGILLFHLFQPGPSNKPVTSDQSPIELHSIPLAELEGQQKLISDWKGDILVVNFWAPWCAPCRREVPTLIRIHRDYEPRGVRVLGIAYDNQPQVSRFAADYQINYPLFLAGNRIAMYNAAFGNRSGALPFTAILDRDQRIAFQHHGEVTAEQLRQKLEAIL